MMLWVRRWIVFLPWLHVLGCSEGLAPGDPPPDPITISVPGFPDQKIPPDNPTTRQGVALGRRLFYDPILSGDGTQACASCHTQSVGFSDNGRRLSVGIDGLEGTRNAQALANVGWQTSFFWDGRASSLEHQALEPVPNPIEMHQEWSDAVAKLRAEPEYADLFGAAFGSRVIDPDRVVKAIAQFERTLVSSNSKYDQVRRDPSRLDADERRGYLLFFSEKGDCFHCHVDGLFTDQNFHNNGLDSEFSDRGREEVTGDPNDRGLFKTPTLRNVQFTAPYMHDGRFGTLQEVLDHYDSGGVYSPTVDPLIRVGTGLGLSKQDKQDLIAFLESLSDSSFLTDPALASP